MPVRPLIPHDTDLYIAIRREMLVDSPWAFGSSPGEGRGSDPDGIRISLAAPPHTGYAIFGAFDDAQPPAATTLLAVAGIIREAALKRRHIAFMWGVYTTPAARSRGLGRAVVSAAIAEAKTWREPVIAQIQLSVSENAPAARTLYESLGFTAWGREPDALRIDGRACSEIHMSLRLST